MANDLIPPGTVLRVRPTGVPRMAITQVGGGGHGLVLRAAERPVMVRTPGLPGAPGPVGEVETIYFSGTGREEPRPARHRVYLEGEYTLESVRATVADAPQGSPWVGDVLTGIGDADPVSIFADTDDRPSIAPLTRTALSVVSYTFPAGSYVCASVVQVGVTFPGTDSVIAVRVLRAG
jgi:hypothetical protein